MTTTTQMSRIRLMSTLNVDDTGFQSLLDIAGLDDADNFTEEEVRALNNAYVAQNSNARNRPRYDRFRGIQLGMWRYRRGSPGVR